MAFAAGVLTMGPFGGRANVESLYPDSNGDRSAGVFPTLDPRIMNPGEPAEQATYRQLLAGAANDFSQTTATPNTLYPGLTKLVKTIWRAIIIDANDIYSELSPWVFIPSTSAAPKLSWVRWELDQKVPEVAPWQVPPPLLSARREEETATLIRKNIGLEFELDATRTDIGTQLIGYQLVNLGSCVLGDVRDGRIRALVHGKQWWKERQATFNASTPAPSLFEFFADGVLTWSIVTKGQRGFQKLHAMLRTMMEQQGVRPMLWLVPPYTGMALTGVQSTDVEAFRAGDAVAVKNVHQGDRVVKTMSDGTRILEVQQPTLEVNSEPLSHPLIRAAEIGDFGRMMYWSTYRANPADFSMEWMTIAMTDCSKGNGDYSPITFADATAASGVFDPITGELDPGRQQFYRALESGTFLADSQLPPPSDDFPPSMWTKRTLGPDGRPTWVNIDYLGEMHPLFDRANTFAPFHAKIAAEFIKRQIANVPGMRLAIMNGLDWMERLSNRPYTQASAWATYFFNENVPLGGAIILPANEWGGLDFGGNFPVDQDIPAGCGTWPQFRTLAMFPAPGDAARDAMEHIAPGLVDAAKEYVQAVMHLHRTYTTVYPDNPLASPDYTPAVYRVPRGAPNARDRDSVCTFATALVGTDGLSYYLMKNRRAFSIPRELIDNSDVRGRLEDILSAVPIDPALAEIFGTAATAEAFVDAFNESNLGAEYRRSVTPPRPDERPWDLFVAEMVVTARTDQDAVVNMFTNVVHLLRHEQAAKDKNWEIDRNFMERLKQPTKRTQPPSLRSRIVDRHAVEAYGVEHHLWIMRLRLAPDVFINATRDNIRMGGARIGNIFPMDPVSLAPLGHETRNPDDPRFDATRKRRIRQWKSATAHVPFAETPFANSNRIGDWISAVPEASAETKRARFAAQAVATDGPEDAYYGGSALGVGRMDLVGAEDYEEGLDTAVGAAFAPAGADLSNRRTQQLPVALRYPVPGQGPVYAAAMADRWDNAQSLGDVFERMAMLMFLFTRPNGKTFEAWAALNIPPPYQFLPERVSMKWLMAAAILAQPGSQLMNTYYGLENWAVQFDAATKKFLGHYTGTYGSHVNDAKYYVIAEDVMAWQYIGGEDCTLWRDTGNYDGDGSIIMDFRDPHAPSVLCRMISAGLTNADIPDPRPITGVVPPGLLHGAAQPLNLERIQEQCLALETYYTNWKWGLHKLNGMAVRGHPGDVDSFHTMAHARNIMLFGTNQLVYDPVTKGHTREIEGTGHWGANERPGFMNHRLVRKMTARYPFGEDTRPVTSVF